MPAENIMCRCGHNYLEHLNMSKQGNLIRSCKNCTCSEFTFSDVIKYKVSVSGTEEKLREVLRNKYHEFCPNCERHLGLSDTSWDDGFNRVICQSCYKTIVDIPMRLVCVANIDVFIRILNEKAEENTAE